MMCTTRPVESEMSRVVVSESPAECGETNAEVQEWPGWKEKERTGLVDARI